MRREGANQPVGPQAQAQRGPLRQALANATLIGEEADAAVYVGTDDEGAEIELVIVADDRSDDGFAVIYAMPTLWRRR